MDTTQNMDNQSFSVRVKSLVYHHQLKSLREHFGYTQEEVAKRCNMPQSYYGEIELLKRFPSEEQAIAIADLFEVDPIELFPKWTMPAFLNDKKIADRVIEIKRVSLNAPEVRLLASPPDLEEEIDRSLLHEQMDELLQTLSPRERRILQFRFGIGKRDKNGEILENKQMTLEEAAKEFGVTRERIRQIEAKAIRKLRHPNRANLVREFWPTQKNEEWLRKHRKKWEFHLTRNMAKHKKGVPLPKVPPLSSSSLFV